MAAPMVHIQHIWDTGHVQDWSEDQPPNFKHIMHFRELTGATGVVQLRWKHNDQTVNCLFPAVVIPDRSGVVLLDEWHFQGQPREGPEPYPQHLRVLNPDGSLRLRIFPPKIDEHVEPEERWIETPRNFAERGMPFGAPASDGKYDMVVEYDWQTGQMLRWINAAPWLRY